MMNEKVLYVDDDPNILRAYERSMRKLFRMDTAMGSAEGLKMVYAKDPYAVVLSDMNMPGMNGIQFLAKVKAHARDTVCIMLTGNADLQTAMQAVNEGNIFRFLTKPCPRETLVKTLEAGVHQYRLVTAERDLLQKTLTGSVKVLTEILSLVNPTAFSRASRIRGYVKHMVAYLQLGASWQFEVAAMLSQIGCVTLPPDVLEKVYNQQKLSADEQKMYAAHPAVGGKLLDNIPRLESVARMIERQEHPVAEETDPQDTASLGAQVLKVAIDFDGRIQQGTPPRIALSQMRQGDDLYATRLLDALNKLPTGRIDQDSDGNVVEMTAWDLQVGVFAYEDIRAGNGLLLVPKWQKITSPILIRLRNFAGGIGLREPFRIWQPNRKAAPVAT